MPKYLKISLVKYLEIIDIIEILSVHGTLKLENRNWKFGLYAFVILMNTVNFGPISSTFVSFIKVVSGSI